MINKAGCFLVGRVQKPHGYKGALQIELFQDISNLIDETEWIFIEFEGCLIPFFIVDYKGLSNESVILDTEEIPEKEAVIKFIGSNVFVKCESNSDAFPIDNYQGFSVFDAENKEIGIIVDISVETMNPLIIIESSSKEEILLPVNTVSLISEDTENKKLFIDFPKELLDL